MPELSTFDLHFSAAENSFSVTAHHDGKQVAHKQFEFPISPVNVAVDLANIKPGSSAETRALIERIGGQLGEALFTGPILESFQEAKQDNQPLTVRLRFDESSSALTLLPWEFLRYNDTYLAASHNYRLYRTPLGISEKPNLHPMPKKVRMLVVISSPLDLEEHERLMMEQEKEVLLRALDSAIAHGKIEVDFEDEPSLENLQAQLDENEYHILHYTGHGAFHDNENFLVLEDERGYKKPEPTSSIVDLLREYPSLKLVFLSGCLTAKTSGQRAFGDLSRAILARTKVDSVVAMQYSISDAAGTKLAERFYHDLVEGKTVD